MQLCSFSELLHSGSQNLLTTEYAWSTMVPVATSQGKMAKAKSKGSVPNKAMHSRVSYLYQAGTYLATQQAQHSTAVAEPLTTRSSNSQGHDATDTAEAEMQAPSESQAILQPASRHLISDLRAVSLKAQMRMSPTMKHAICKNCDTLLVDGSTCISEVENKSKGGRKPWADILVRTCNTCGTVRRFPVAAERQKRRPQRSIQSPEEISRLRS